MTRREREEIKEKEKEKKNKKRKMRKDQNRKKQKGRRNKGKNQRRKMRIKRNSEWIKKYNKKNGRENERKKPRDKEPRAPQSCRKKKEGCFASPFIALIGSLRRGSNCRTWVAAIPRRLVLVEMLTLAWHTQALIFVRPHELLTVPNTQTTSAARLNFKPLQLLGIPANS